MITDNRELTDAQTRDLVRRGVAKGRRMNATRRAVSGVAALAVVGALSVGAFNLVGAVSPTNVAPTAPLSPTAPKETPPAAKTNKAEEDGKKPPRSTEFLSSHLLKPTLEAQLPEGSTVTVPDDASKGPSASAKVLTDDGYVTVTIGIIDWRNDQRVSEWGVAHLVDGYTNVWFVPGTYDGKQGQDSWYLQRADGAAVWFRVSNVKGVSEDGKRIVTTSSTTPFDTYDVAALLDTPEWDLILDDALSG
ncbi:MAG: hypothetical protein QM713_02985 [Arachnia sp.]